MKKFRRMAIISEQSELKLYTLKKQIINMTKWVRVAMHEDRRSLKWDSISKSWMTRKLRTKKCEFLVLMLIWNMPQAIKDFWTYDNIATGKYWALFMSLIWDTVGKYFWIQALLIYSFIWSFFHLFKYLLLCSLYWWYRWEKRPSFWS